MVDSNTPMTPTNPTPTEEAREKIASIIAPAEWKWRDQEPEMREAWDSRCADSLAKADAILALSSSCPSVGEGWDDAAVERAAKAYDGTFRKGNVPIWECQPSKKRAHKIKAMRAALLAAAPKPPCDASWVLGMKVVIDPSIPDGEVHVGPHRIVNLPAAPVAPPIGGEAALSPPGPRETT